MCFNFDDFLNNHAVLQGLKCDIYNTYKFLCYCYKNHGKVLSCGNGGSAADAGHITAELMKGFLLKRGLHLFDKSIFSDQFLAERLQYGLPAISLSAQSELITAICNDNGADMVFAQQVFAYGRKDDILLAFSTSGNSENVVNAAKVAKGIGMKVIAFTGADGGALKTLADVAICVPAKETYRVQEYHLPIYHAICAMVEQAMFGENKEVEALHDE